MSIVNHGAVGALIAIVIKQPALVLPLALLSHFIMDALPHFGYEGKGFGEAIGHKLTLVDEAFNIPAFIVLVILLIPFGWLAYAAAATAILPDTAWPIRYFFFERSNKPPKPNGRIVRFHHWIQWCEKPWGIAIEIPVSIALLSILYIIRP